ARRGTAQHGTARHGAARHGAARRGTARHEARRAPRGAIRRGRSCGVSDGAGVSDQELVGFSLFSQSGTVFRRPGIPFRFGNTENRTRSAGGTPGPGKPAAARRLRGQ
ncbi:hypothetical protein AB0K00_56365, partial [Dactylosporangium sp. NPDC049525]|uniref:hypothetical protein n=1 Tax=Dactylosporangium sp. NPDC049525 TaxID=3154730 RepID=UPI0034463301